MRLAIAADQVRRLLAALARHGRREIGGQLYGEQLEPSNFRITELTIQSRPGTFARFVVDLVESAKGALGFFDRHGHAYARFNYIGEWHSHPSFEVTPSATDARTMRSVVEDPAFRGQFAVLVILRLDESELVSSATLFAPGAVERAIALEVEDEQ